VPSPHTKEELSEAKEKIRQLESLHTLETNQAKETINQLKSSLALEQERHKEMTDRANQLELTCASKRENLQKAASKIHQLKSESR